MRHRPVRDIAALILRHTYGTVTAVTADGSSLTLSKDFPVLPVTSPETAVASALMLQVQADGTNGTLFYDVDAQTRAVVHDFAAEASTLSGKYVRSRGPLPAERHPRGRAGMGQQRLQQGMAESGRTRGPRGCGQRPHLRHERIRTLDPVTVNANTEFFFRTPANAQADATPIATGTAFLATQDLVRGFKVHVSVVDPLATPMVAQTIDIENATYAGRISNAELHGIHLHAQLRARHRRLCRQPQLHLLQHRQRSRCQ